MLGAEDSLSFLHDFFVDRYRIREVVHVAVGYREIMKIGQNARVVFLLDLFSFLDHFLKSRDRLLIHPAVAVFQTEIAQSR